MILPIVAYGHPLLRKVAKEVEPNYPDLKQLIDNMFETMYFSSGVGLAAPQVNLSIQLIVIDASPHKEKYPQLANFTRVLINPEIVEEEGEIISISEGCLSIPHIDEFVERNSKIHVRYLDANYELHDEVYDGMVARIMQHEIDHLKGILFVDHLNPLKKMILKRKLNDISRGLVDVDYKMIFPLLKKYGK